MRSTNTIGLAIVGGIVAFLLVIFACPKLANPAAFATAAATPPLDPACKQWVETHRPSPGSAFGLTVSTSTINVELKIGETKEVMTITSTTSTGFNFCGYPYPPGSPDLIWSPWSGGLHNGGSTTVTVTAAGKPRLYTGMVTLFDLDTGNSVDIPVKVLVTN